MLMYTNIILCSMTASTPIQGDNPKNKLCFQKTKTEL